ncbi:beta-ketoacyl synthase N-terminal-like domain-containing protein [Streptomyces sp. DSM 42041]|uniref:Beta-ketoacyl synthase N-terminal-like domain-containing protein n=1 Tax=Streptomyces hazeniae TaxID=3075538 RepID=A0ABU2NN91_9ACTN|nr:beta-ketoacyl synthase N-terminal-like domain-containing protein [Streptomyces sp. DSM 42041]MDT0378447.1 beta-ketoacyl synthase N-terminal-like domain-containing protein [Streptomyces sp. DSM 42041]
MATNTEELRRVITDQLALSRRLKARVAELEERRHEPVAVVGMAMRLPGSVDTPDGFRDFLYSDDPDARAITPIPEDRPALRAVYHPEPGTEGRSYADRAAFLSDIASFDASFFGISHREAESMDPQQRMLLEVSWEALERAGIAPRRQDRLPVGVFVGVMAAEYGQRLAQGGDYSRMDPYSATGSGHCFTAGRISYALGLSGPAASVDTACSSSLVALHQAVRALRGGECDYALAGGANLILGADLMVALCQSEALSPSGRSRTFLADADGYGRGEGVGMVALMRLSDAVAQQRPVLAVLRGTAVNHDGASSGFTVPSGPAQQEVVRSALADARTDPSTVGYVEAHGTGTALGDPVEVGALDAVVGNGAGRRAAPVALGSLKSRMGHLEAAAGIAGVLKTVLLLRDGRIPAGAEKNDPLNPLIPWDRIGLDVPCTVRPWPGDGAERVAGVSAFGLSGTNAHVVLAAHAPSPADPVTAPQGHPELLTLSARSPEALAALVQRTRIDLAGRDAAGTAALCHTMRAGRVHFAHRVAVTGDTAAALDAALAEGDGGGDPSAGAVPVGRIGLAVDGDEVAVEAALNAVAEHFPRLRPVVERPGDAAGRLRGLLARLGVTTTPVGDTSATAGGAGRDEEPDGGPRPGTAHARLESSGRSLPLVGADPSRTPHLLTAALAALYAGGAELRLDALAAAGAAFTEAPTYPFQHKRFWLDEEPAPLQGAPETHAAQPATAPGLTPEEMVPFLTEELATALKADCALSPEVSFAEVGGDSFTAMLITRSVEQRLGTDLPTLDCPVEMPVGELVRHLEQQVTTALGWQR